MESKKTQVLNFEDLKQTAKKYKFVRMKLSKLGEQVVVVDGTILFYIAQRNYGLGFQINNVDGWITKRITTKNQLQKKFDTMEKLHNANKQVFQARVDLCNL